MPYREFYELEAWKQARQFKVRVFGIVRRFPADEQFELSSQLRRAVRSIASNIAEGYGRRTVKDELNFCTMARGSYSEVLNHLIDAMDSGYISAEELASLKLDWENARKVLNGYMNFLKSKNSSGIASNKASGTVAEEEAPYQNETSDCEASFFKHLERN